MPVPTVYRKSTEQVLASYSAVDFIDGTGIVEFYGAANAISGAVITYNLTRNDYFAPANVTLAGAPVQAYNSSFASTTSSTYTEIMDLDFDTSVFNQPATIRGTLIANIPFATNFSNSAVIGNIYSQIFVYKVDAAAVETLIGSGNSKINATAANRSYADGAYFTVPVTLPLTLFKKGEKLRITVKAYVNADDSGATIGGLITYDPGSRAVYNTITKSAGYSRMSFFVPFKIDI